MLRVAFLKFRIDTKTEKKWGDLGISLVATTKSEPPPEVLLVPIESTKDLKGLAPLRKKYPKSLIVGALSKTISQLVAKTPLLQGLASHPALDDLVYLPHLKMEMALHLARWTRAIESKRLALENGVELDSLRKEFTVLSEHSQGLVEQMERDLGMATDVQRALFPKETPIVPGVSVAAKYLPAAGLGGDYYDIFEFGDRKLFGLLLADSKTHGMAAALLSVLLKTSLTTMKDRFPQTDQFIAFLNHEFNSLPATERAEMSVLYAILDRASLRLRLTSAGGLCPLLWRKGELQKVTWLRNPALGNLDHFIFRETEIALQPGDRLLFFTDGLVVPLQEGRKEFTKTLEDILRGSGNEPSDSLEFQNEVLARIYRYKAEQTLKDDLTFIYLSIDEKALYLTSQSSK